MKIIADQQLPLVKELFSKFGEVQCLAGRDISASVLEDADVLLVRSITKVDQALLQSTKIGYVASMTAGTDHLDTQWLDANNIKWSYAPGFNAPPVADYIVCTIAGLMRCRLLTQPNLTVAVIGVGQVGSLVAQRLKLLGYKVLLCDPFRANEENFSHTSFADIKDVDLITLHVPLTSEGPYPTEHMVNAEFLAQQKAGCVMINSSRGAVVDTKAIKQNKHMFFCCDVWEHEPTIDVDALQQVLLATPHIAGYSVQSKIRGIYQLYNYFCQQLAIPTAERQQPEFPQQTLRFAAAIDHWQDVVLGVFNPLLMTNLMRHQFKASPQSPFDALRSQFNYRQEFQFTQLQPQQYPAHDAAILAGLGFKL